MQNQEFLYSYYSQVYEQGNQLTRKFLIAFSILGLAFSALHQTWWVGIIGSASNLIIFYLCSSLGMSKALMRYIISFLYGNFSLQIILEMQGSSTAFFTYFICFTILLFFENWSVIIPVTVHALVSVGAIIYWADTPLLKDNLPLLANFTPIEIAVHYFLMISFSALCMYWAVLQRNQTKESAEKQWNSLEQLKAMEANIKFANELSVGNLKTDYPAASIDTLGESLLTMRKSLIASQEREDQERFHTAGLAEVGEILRRNSNNLEELSDQVIEKLVKYLKANQGSLFVTHEEDSTITLVACRAWERKKFIKKTVHVGEGLIGQAVLEKETIYLTKVPEGYITITSGLGAANP